MSNATLTQKSSKKGKNNRKSDCAAAINSRFEALAPELENRFRRMATCYPRNMRRTVVDDAMGEVYLNYAGAFKRGKRLTASELAYFGQFHIKHRSTITRRRYPSRRSKDCLSLEEAECGDFAAALGKALTTSERASPFEQVRVKIDWHEFANEQPIRHQKILYGLSIGESKGTIANKLAISRGRLSQVLDDIGREVKSRFEDA